MRNQLSVALVASGAQALPAARAGNPANIQGARRLCNGYRCQANDTNYARLNAIARQIAPRSRPAKNESAEKREFAAVCSFDRAIAPDFTSRARTRTRACKSQKRTRGETTYVHACVSARADCVENTFFPRGNTVFRAVSLLRTNT